MKSIFQNFFGASREENADKAGILPLPASIDDLCEHQKRAMTGWIAGSLGRKLGLEITQAGNMIYAAFSYEALAVQPEPDDRYLLFLAHSLVEWLSQEADVYIRLKEMGLPEKYHRLLLEVYEEIKQDGMDYLPRARSGIQAHTEEDEVWEVYRDVIHAATQGKFLLIRKDEAARFKQGAILCEAPITERADIPKARELAKEKLVEIGAPQSGVMSHLLVISEAITNILKHAKDGKMTIYAADSFIHVFVEDSGPGFPLKLLPNATLMAGYSTKRSLGQGFTLMMKMADRILLSTTPGEGSTLILILNRKQGTS